tara:strand:+ start:603 stop:845 length:243 start_codon:yes stop_codon:yes gene_type:complete
MEIFLGEFIMSPEEWNDKREADMKADKIRDVIEEWGPHNVARAIDEIDNFLKDVDNEFHLTLSQRSYLNRTRLTFDKIFK